MRYRLALVVTLLSSLASATASAQELLPKAAAPASETTESPPAESKRKADPELQLLLASPQTCLETFRRAVNEGDWKDAIECLDFSGFASQESKANGESLAYHLNQILDNVQLNPLPVAPDFDGDCLLSTYARDQTGNALEGTHKIDFDRIAISRSESDGLWRFAPGTVARIDEIYENWKPELEEQQDLGNPKPTAIWLADQFPESLQARHFLIADYMWICLAAVVVLGFLADALVGFLALNFSKTWFGFTRSDEKDDAIRKLWKPAGLLLQALVWYYGTALIGLPTWATDYLSSGLKFFAVFAAIWVVFRLIDIASGFLAIRAEKTPSRLDDLLIPLVSKSLKVLALLFGLLICAETFHLPIKGLLGGLGLGGMALALASKDAISNLFGSFTVLLDRPFEIGDWVIAENIEGTVEQVGFRSTRIRTFYNSLITLPNSRLTTAIVDNMGRRRYRRVKTTIGVQYSTTPEQLDAFCEGIRELIRRSPASRKDYFHVYFNGFGESSLDVMVYCFLRVPDWSTELREKHQLFTSILRLAQELKVEFAFPTRTLHMHPETALPAPPAMPHADAEILGRESAARIAEHLQTPHRS
jgi:MscS family membrane protein